MRLSEFQERLEQLACPACRGPLCIETLPFTGLACAACRLVYPLYNRTIPILLKEKASPRLPERSPS